jgi:hypothetical protein
LGIQSLDAALITAFARKECYDAAIANFISAHFEFFPRANRMLPAFDSEALCTDVAGTSARQELSVYGCMDFQDRMRKEISPAGTAPGLCARICAKAAEGTGDYWKLKTCIDQKAGSRRRKHPHAKHGLRKLALTSPCALAQGGSELMINIHHFAPGEDVVDEAALEQFQKQWATYQKLVDHNSLASKEAGERLHAALAGLTQPFAFIACVMPAR